MSAGESIRVRVLPSRWGSEENPVSVEPGQIRLTRMPCCRTSSARDSVNPTTPNLDAQYTALVADPTFPAIDAILMMWPVRREIIEGSTYLEERKILRRFVSRMAS